MLCFYVPGPSVGPPGCTFSSPIISCCLRRRKHLLNRLRASKTTTAHLFHSVCPRVQNILESLTFFSQILGLHYMFTQGVGMSIDEAKWAHWVCRLRGSGKVKSWGASEFTTFLGNLIGVRVSRGNCQAISPPNHDDEKQHTLGGIPWP